MRLVLSSAAAPGASPDELAAACVRRGLTGVELVHGEGYAAESDRAMGFAAAARAAGLELAGVVRPSLSRQDLHAAAREGATLGAPVIVPISAFDRTILGAAAEAFTEVGATLLLAHGGDPEMAKAIVKLLDPVPGAEAIGLAWELRPGADDPRFVRYVLSSAGQRLAYVRLFGGGPEAQAQTGTGIGATMAHLALARYAGPLVLVPSSSRYHYAWSAWLGRAGGWGCGSKQSDSTLVTLATSTGAY